MDVSEQSQTQPPAKRKLTVLQRIGRIVWDSDDKSPEERRYVRKLDCMLMSIALLGYFVKYLSQANIANAYASGMKEALEFKGNQYNTLLTMFTVGYVIGQFPGSLLLVKVSPSIWLPTCEVVWTALVMCCTAAKSVRALYALRFLIGLLEASAYPGMIWVLGSWYGPAELAKRVVMFQASSSVGTMFSGYLQAAVHSGLNGKHGLAGYQWLFIMDGVICLPIAIAGYFCIPDVPHKFNPRSRWYFNQKDLDMAHARSIRFKRAPTKGFDKKVFVQVFTSWVPYAFFVPYTCMVISLGSYAYMNLWLKATPGYNSVTQINVIPTGGYAISIFMSLVYSWTSDGIGKRWPILLAGCIPPFVGNVILSTWPPGNAAKFAGFFLNFTATSVGAIMLSWANEMLSESAEARAIILGFLNTAAYVFNAWVPNLIWPASQAPHYKAGYQTAAVFYVVFFLGTIVILYLSRKYAVPRFLPSSNEYAATTESKTTADDASGKAEEAADGAERGIAFLAPVDGRATNP